MAAIGKAARNRIGQLCAARQHISVARLRTTAQAALDRSQSTSVPNVVPATKTWEDFSLTRQAWSRATPFSDGFSGYTRGYDTRSYATSDGADKVSGAGKTSGTSGSDAISEEMRVDTMVRDELGEPEGGPEPGLKEKSKSVANTVGKKMKDAGKSIKDSTDSEAMNKVGDSIKGAGDTLKDKSSNKTGLGKEDVVTS